MLSKKTILEIEMTTMWMMWIIAHTFDEELKPSYREAALWPAAAFNKFQPLLHILHLRDMPIRYSFSFLL